MASLRCPCRGGFGAAQQSFAEGELVGGRDVGQGVQERVGGGLVADAAQGPCGGLGHVVIGVVEQAWPGVLTALVSRRTPMLPMTPTSSLPWSLPAASRRALSTAGSGIVSSP